MKILIVDDHEIFRLGLRALLEAEPEIEVVAEAGDGQRGLQLIVEHEPDVVILDYSMPGISGLDVLHTLRKRHPALKLVLLTASRSESVLSEALVSGAHAVVLKQDTSDQLVQAIGSVLQGNRVISTSITPLVKRIDRLTELTKRERQVLRMIANGYRNREISNDLNVSLKTIDSHRTNLMRKLHLHSLADLIDFANKTGITDSSI